MGYLSRSYRLGQSEGYSNKDYALHTGGNYNVVGTEEDAGELMVEDLSETKPAQDWKVYAGILIVVLGYALLSAI